MSALTEWQDTIVRHHEARMLVKGAGENIHSVYLVMSAGDSDIIVGGKSREAVFYIDNDGAAKTAVVCGDTVITRDGW